MENTLETLTARMEDIQAQIDDLAQEGSNEIYNQLCDEREVFELEIETMVDDLEAKLNGYIDLSQRQDTHVHGAKVGVDRKIHAKTKMLLENYLAHRFKPFIESSARPSFKTGLFEAGAALRVKR
jgi:iron-sulfur cluster repair protein YtfE (RIC family)